MVGEEASEDVDEAGVEELLAEEGEVRLVLQAIKIQRRRGGAKMLIKDRERITIEGIRGRGRWQEGVFLVNPGSVVRNR